VIFWSIFCVVVPSYSCLICFLHPNPLDRSNPRLTRERGQPGSPIALQPILQRSIGELGFTSNRSKRPAVLEVSAQKLEALKRTLARGLGKRSQLRHLELLARPRKISTKKSRKIISKFTTCQLPNYLAPFFPRYLASAILE
jgi:hypothetical protein